MDKTKISLILITALIASGCAMPTNTPEEENTDDGPDLAEDRGLRIAEFRPTDDTLRPSQEAILNLRLKNYHTRDISIEEISIYNEGLLTVPSDSKECTPSPSELSSASAGTYPEIECQWNLEAPPKDAYGSFDSKPTSVNLRLVYESSLTNQEPFKVEFKPLEEINSTNPISKTFSNSEVSMTVSTETPVPSSEKRVIDVKTKEIGKGRIVADTNYSFSFIPERVFGSECSEEDAPVVGKELEFSCNLNGEGLTGTRNLIFSTSYKYVKEPVLNIKLVNNQ